MSSAIWIPESAGGVRFVIYPVSRPAAPPGLLMITPPCAPPEKTAATTAGAAALITALALISLSFVMRGAREHAR